MTRPRIVSLLPSVTEMLFAIGAGEQVVGVTHECDQPAAALRLPRLTRTRLAEAARDGASRAAAIDREVHDRLADGEGLYALDAEGLRALAPDVVVTQALCDVCAVSFTTVERVVATLPVPARHVSLEPSSLREVEDSILQLGTVADREREAAALVDEMRARIDAVAQAVAERPRRRTVLLEWTEPPFGAGHWSPACVAVAGGEPLCGFPGAASETLSWEQVRAADPEVIVVAPCGWGIDDALAALDALAEREAWWRAFVAERALVVLDGNRFVNRPSHQLARTVELLGAAIHPGAFPEPPADELVRVGGGKEGPRRRTGDCRGA